VAETGAAFAAALRDVVVRYPGRPPLGPLNLSVAHGEIVAVVGASGAGKSTVLRLLAGLERPSEGETARGSGRSRAGFVFQNPTLMPWANIRANVALPLELAGTPPAIARQKAAAAPEAVGLGDRPSARPRQLSGGMAIPPSLAPALVSALDLLPPDQPFARLVSVTPPALHPKPSPPRAERSPRPAMVFVTHDVEEAVYLAGRAVLLDAATGQVRAELPSPGVFPRPDGWRADAGYHAAVERLATGLERSMAPVRFGTGS